MRIRSTSSVESRECRRRRSFFDPSSGTDPIFEERDEIRQRSGFDRTPERFFESRAGRVSGIAAIPDHRAEIVPGKTP
jgi:hypothetical protein